MEGALLERWLAQCFDETHYTRSRNIAYFLDGLHLASRSQGRPAASLNHAARHDGIYLWFEAASLVFVSGEQWQVGTFVCPAPIVLW
jgi:hypothetical protein